MDVIDQNKLLDAGFNLLDAKYDKGWHVYIKTPERREWHSYRKVGSKQKFINLFTALRKEFTYIDLFNRLKNH